MGLFDKMREPVFLKESSNALEQLESLRLLEPLLNKEGQTLIKQEIKCLEYGIAGEKNIAFELKNSHIPMYILRDIYLEDGDLSAQIDYLVFTRKICFVIECKNLYGDIEINSAGDFIRTMEFGGKKKREGIYSPITQNQRHLELMKKIKVDKRNNILAKFMVGKYCFL
ncbi:MAG TPA: nuclease-related domain-containing protein [Lachnospiraceae bacterium]|nr:nuclease-related domain-containing protein [Lachnospiraceae bacterium]